MVKISDLSRGILNGISNASIIVGYPIDLINKGVEIAITRYRPQYKNVLEPEIPAKFYNPTYLPGINEFKKFFERYPNRWAEFIDGSRTKNTSFEILNKEYIEELVRYIIERAKAYGATKTKPLRILEAGAGNGRLTHFLREKIEQEEPGLVIIIATDSNELGIKANFPVEVLNHRAAMEKYKPDIAIWSWMPANTDYTADLRKSMELKEYILIGPRCGICGNEWETWGKPEYGPSNAEPPFVSDGFETVDTKNRFEGLQTLPTSVGSWPKEWISKTNIFRRKM